MILSQNDLVLSHSALPTTPPLSPASSTQEEKRKQRNREAALRCREKKRQKEEKLTTTCQTLQRKTEHLQQFVDQLLEEKQKLERMLLDHDLGCGCDAAKRRRESGDVLKMRGGMEAMKKEMLKGV